MVSPELPSASADSKPVRGLANVVRLRMDAVRRVALPGRRVVAALGIGVLLACATVRAAADETGGKPSILFLNIDDLNDWNEVLGGHPQARTPNLQRLAARGLTFTRAICASPVCFPSRTAVFSGIHPARSDALSNFNWGKPWRFYVPEAVTLPKQFEAAGWTTIGAGKNFHDADRPEFGRYFPRPREVKTVEGTGYESGPLGWAVADVPYEEMPDYQVVSWGVQQIESTPGPLFLALGIYRPHVPWYLPQSSFDKYPLDEFREPETLTNDLDDLPERLQLLAHNEAKFGRGYHQALRKAGQTKAWARAYMASATFADEQLGRVLDAWEASEHGANSYIVVWSDHGYMLGEKEGWGKFKPWYDASHCNLIIAGPGIPRGAVCNKAVCLLDLYPTLLELLHVPPPSAQTLDGNSLVPLLRDPDAQWDHPVVMSHEEDGIRYDVVLDNRYRMTRLITGETELYDHQSDPNEWYNLATRPESAAVIERLSEYVTFGYPDIPADGWLEAEALPRQTSADYGRRGNYQYRVREPAAYGGELVEAHFKMGRESYIDFVVSIPDPGTYQLEAVVQHVSPALTVTVRTDDVMPPASQATAEAEMKSLPTPILAADKKASSFEDVVLGEVTYDRPGLKLIRFLNTADAPGHFRVDRIRVQRVSGP